MNQQIIQHLLVVVFFLIYCLLTKKKVFAFIYLISLPFIFYYLVDAKIMLISLVLAVSVYEYTLTRNKVFLYLFGLSVLVALILLRSSSGVYHPTLNIIDFQRGEHPDFQTNLVAKLLHNKFSLFFQYLDRLFSEVSLASLFADGKYRSFSNYVPLGYLFPWDLVLILMALRTLGKKLFNPLLLLFFLFSFFTITFTSGTLPILFVTSLVLLLGLFSSFTLSKLPLYIAAGLLVFNSLYLCLFSLPVNILWDLEYGP